ncbi:MAG TPA: YbhB/YbcL family Raf kinase inhibitor-like protein [Gemmatimonadaceae bacterium]|nr:YbhB/YbcL family Raf kinase inhibitor-like protein [Gemmatimonadaceae bacterium]
MTPLSTLATAATASVRAPDAPTLGATLRVVSDSFTDGGAMPADYVFTAAGGKNKSPQLSWSGAPRGTKSFAVTCFDPDAPTGSGYWHWVAFNIPANVDRVDVGEGKGESPRDAMSGYTDFGMSGYAGPWPPAGDGQHHYTFTVYALDVPDVDGGSDKTTGATLIFLTRGHVLATGSITGLFGL